MVRLDDLNVDALVRDAALTAVQEQAEYQRQESERIEEMQRQERVKLLRAALLRVLRIETDDTFQAEQVTVCGVVLKAWQNDWTQEPLLCPQRVCSECGAVIVSYAKEFSDLVGFGLWLQEEHAPNTCVSCEWNRSASLR